MTEHSGIADWLHLVPVIVGYALILVACGDLVTRCVFPRSSTHFDRLAVRLILGTAVLPMVVIAGHELLGIKAGVLLLATWLKAHGCSNAIADRSFARLLKPWL